MLLCDEVVEYKVPKPVPYMKDIVVELFLVHGTHDFVDVCSDGGMVALASI